MQVRVGPIGKSMSVKCPNCGKDRYITDENVVEKCWFCGAAEFEVDIRPINKYGACEAHPR